MVSDLKPEKSQVPSTESFTGGLAQHLALGSLPFKHPSGVNMQPVVLLLYLPLFCPFGRGLWLGSVVFRPGAMCECSLPIHQQEQESSLLT